MSDLEPLGYRSALPFGVTYREGRADRRARQLSSALAVTAEQALVRAARVNAEAYVQTEKLHEIDNLAREAMRGHALLSRWRDTLAGSDALSADELRFFTDTARLGKGEILADTISAFGQR